MKPPVDGMTKVPMGLPMMFDAWAACVAWAIETPEAREAFTKATNMSVESVARARGIDAMIDEATGYRKKVMAAFCDWVTETIWGEEGKPEPQNDVSNV